MVVVCSLDNQTQTQKPTFWWVSSSFKKVKFVDIVEVDVGNDIAQNPPPSKLKTFF